MKAYAMWWGGQPPRADYAVEVAEDIETLRKRAKEDETLMDGFDSYMDGHVIREVTVPEGRDGRPSSWAIYSVGPVVESTVETQDFFFIQELRSGAIMAAWAREDYAKKFFDNRPLGQSETIQLLKVNAPASLARLVPGTDARAADRFYSQLVGMFRKPAELVGERHGWEQQQPQPQPQPQPPQPAEEDEGQMPMVGMLRVRANEVACAY